MENNRPADFGEKRSQSLRQAGDMEKKQKWVSGHIHIQEEEKQEEDSQAPG